MNEFDEHVLTVLATYWRDNPDQRLGQLLLNLTRMDGRVDPHALWNTTSHDLLQKMYKEIEKKYSFRK